MLMYMLSDHILALFLFVVGSKHFEGVSYVELCYNKRVGGQSQDKETFDTKTQGRKRLLIIYK